MTWTELNSYSFRGIDGAHYWVIEQFSNPGKLWVYIPEFSASRDDRLILGVADVPSRSKRPAYVGAKVIRITDYGQYHFFDVPSLENPCLGIRRERISSDGTLTNFISGIRPRVEMTFLSLDYQIELPILASIPSLTAGRIATYAEGFRLEEGGEVILPVEDPSNAGIYYWVGEVQEERLKYAPTVPADFATADPSNAPILSWSPTAQNNWFEALHIGVFNNSTALLDVYGSSAKSNDTTTIAKVAITGPTKMDMISGPPSAIEYVNFQAMANTVNTYLSVQIEYRNIYVP